MYLEKELCTPMIHSLLAPHPRMSRCKSPSKQSVRARREGLRHEHFPLLAKTPDLLATTASGERVYIYIHIPRHIDVYLYVYIYVCVHRPTRRMPTHTNSFTRYNSLGRKRP